MDKLPRYNVYVCEYGCHTITVDVDKGTTPFMIKCASKPRPNRPIAKKYLGEDGECIGTAKSTFYPTKGVPDNVVATHEWYKPNYLELQHFHSPDEREHVERGGLLMRPRTDKEPIYHE